MALVSLLQAGNSASSFGWRVWVQIYLQKRSRVKGFKVKKGFIPVICMILFFAGGLQAADENPGSEKLLDMVQALQIREKNLDNRETALLEEEKRIEMLRHELDLKRQEMESVKSEVEKLLNDLQGLKDEDLSRLVEVYTAMKPDAAAPLLTRLDLKYAVEVILRMPPKKSAKLLSAVKADRAAEISREITRLKPTE